MTRARRPKALIILGAEYEDAFVTMARFGVRAVVGQRCLGERMPTR
jgi:hypothetical protein